MNQEQFQGFWKQLEAPLKAKWDKLTDQDLLQIDGNMLKFSEILDLRYGAEKEAVSTWAHRRYAHISGNYAGYEFGLQDPELTPK